MNLLVTGGAGFIGSHFVRSTLAGHLPGLADARVTVLDKMTYAASFANLGPFAEDKHLDFVPGDVCDAALVASVARHQDAIIHFAAETAADRSAATDPADAAQPFAAANVVGTQVLLDAARHHGVTRFLQCSTAEVYGPAGTGAHSERSPLAPATPYAATKAGADLLALAAHRTHRLPVVVVRASLTYGPGQHPEKLIPGLITTLLDDGTVTPGTALREWLHVDDHCRGLALALLRGRPGEIYHVGGSIELTDTDLAEVLRAECGTGQIRPVAPTRHQHHRYALDDDKTRQELGWRPRVEFTTGLAATVGWYRDNPTRWRPQLTP